MVESLYFGTPLLGFGQDGDQFGALHRMKRLGVARFGFPERSPEEIYNQISEMLFDPEISTIARDNTAKLMRLMEFEELRQGDMMKKTVDYTIKFGDSHLISPVISYSWTVKHDWDIKLCLILITLMTYYTLRSLICSKCSK